MLKGSTQFGAGKTKGIDQGWDEAKSYFKEQTGMDFDTVCNKGKITAIFYGDLLFPSEKITNQMFNH
jgi:hypothetical protein